MKAGYDGSFRQESMAFSSPEVIVIDDSSDDEEQVLAFPSEEHPVKSEFDDPLPGSRGEAARDGLGAHTESSASTVDHHDVDDCPSAKKRLRELFRSSVGPFSDEKAAAALALKSRHAKRAPPPTRLNSTIRKVAVRRNSESVGELPVTPSPPPDAKAMIQSSPISKFAEATRSLTAQATAAAPAKIFVDAPWPPRVAYLHDYYNPKAIKLPYVHHFGDCGCDDPCKIDTCRNARMNLLCTDSCCIWEELCSNRPRESPKVKVMQDAKTCQYAVEVLGEYLGQLRCIPKDPSRRTRNKGFMLRMHVRTDGAQEQCVGIDAQHLGGRMRFANHSCVANAQFFEVANGRRHTVVVVSTQDILPGAEVFVNYGKDLWFVCKCRDTKCVHRDIQDQDDP
ncbi:hypothetical protein PR003_g9317 [Phytophthora rubi]|uniref:SET domain-containing protein n=1 Tax=Phytophthora rubi TaxID=129364 RepID=A0A6A4F8L1_9STRA|nr:hypothetical protein PR003_g9317 [Phytophthora rubi]